LPQAKFAGEPAAKSFTTEMLKKLVGVGLKLQHFPKAYQLMQEAHWTNRLGTIVPRHFSFKAVTELTEEGLIWLITELLAKPTKYTTAGLKAFLYIY